MTKRQYIINKIVDYYTNVPVYNFDDPTRMNTEISFSDVSRGDIQERTEKEVDKFINVLGTDVVYSSIKEADTTHTQEYKTANSVFKSDFEYVLDCLYECAK